jgi:two-component system, NarL family, sensor kinase
MEDQKLNIFQIIFGTALIILLFTCFIVSILYFYQKKHFLFHKQIADLKLSFEKDLLQSRLEIQEQTFQHISREIHDNMGGNLSLSKLHLTSLNYPGSVSNEEKINSSIQIIGNVIQNLRDISKSLNSDLIKESGLFCAIENELSIIRKTGLYKIYFEVYGEPFDLSPDKALIVFRIIQEGFNNIIKHAKSTSIRLDMIFDTGTLDIDITDNGAGFIQDEKHMGSGLRNIRQRTKMLEGECEIISSIGNGTTLKISIPFIHS